MLDLDNTLWGGVVGETGAAGRRPRREPRRRGLSAPSRSTSRPCRSAASSWPSPRRTTRPTAASRSRRTPTWSCGLDDIAAVEINWEPKGTTIRRLAETLSLGLDSFVFFDDNPAEREQVRQAIPEVDVVDVPAEPAEYVRALQAGLWFETTSLTEADRERAEQYAVERKRRELQQSAGIDGRLPPLARDGRPMSARSTRPT